MDRTTTGTRGARPDLYAAQSGLPNRHATRGNLPNLRRRQFPRRSLLSPEPSGHDCYRTPFLATGAPHDHRRHHDVSRTEQSTEGTAAPHDSPKDPYSSKGETSHETLRGSMFTAMSKRNRKTRHGIGNRTTHVRTHTKRYFSRYGMGQFATDRRTGKNFGSGDSIVASYSSIPGTNKKRCFVLRTHKCSSWASVVSRRSVTTIPAESQKTPLFCPNTIRYGGSHHQLLWSEYHPQFHSLVLFFSAAANFQISPKRRIQSILFSVGCPGPSFFGSGWY